MPQITGRNYLWTDDDKKRGAKDRETMQRAARPALKSAGPIQYSSGSPWANSATLQALKERLSQPGASGSGRTFGGFQPSSSDRAMHEPRRAMPQIGQADRPPIRSNAEPLQGTEEGRLSPRAMDSPAPPPNITRQPGMIGKRGPLPVSQSMGQPQQQPQPAGFQPDENLINFWLNNLENRNTNVKSMPGGEQIVSRGVMVPGLSTEEHYNYTPDMREAYAEKIRQQLIENNRQREEYSRNNPRGGIVETIRGMDQTFRNTQGSREYGSLGEAQRQRSFEQDAAKQALEADLEKERIKAKADTDSAVIRGRYGVEQAKVGATNKAKDYTKERADYGKWYSDNMSGAGGDPVKARILGEQLWDVQNADKIDAKVFTDPQTGDIKLKYKDGAEVVIPASDLNGNDLVSNWDWGRTDWRKQNQRGIS